MRLLLKRNVIDDNLKQHCKQVHEKAKLLKCQKMLTFNTTYEEPPKKKRKMG